MQERQGVEPAIQVPDFVMQVGCRGCTGVSGIAEQLAAFYITTDLSIDLAHVAVNGRKAVVVNDLDHLAEAAVVVERCPFDDAIGGGVDGSARGRSQVNAPVHGHPFLNRVQAHAEIARNDLGFDRKATRNRFKHEAFFEGGLAGRIDALGQWSVGLCAQSDHDFDRLQLIAHGHKRCGFFFDLALEKGPFLSQLIVGGEDFRLPLFQVHQFAVEPVDAAVEPVEQQGARQGENEAHRRTAGQRSPHQLRQGEMASAAVVGDRDQVTISHELERLIEVELSRQLPPGTQAIFGPDRRRPTIMRTRCQ